MVPRPEIPGYPMHKDFHHHPPIANPLRSRLNMALFDLHTPLGLRTNLLIIIIVVLSVLLSMISTLQAIPADLRQWLHILETAVSVAFAAEYFTRILVARSPKAYAFSFYGLVDLLSWLPLLLFGDAQLALRLLRILRLLKLLRYMRALRMVLTSMRDITDIVLVVAAGIVIIVLIAGNLIHAAEPEHFPDAFAGSWWGIVTLTTVGYGDMVPHTTLGKVGAALLMIAGISMFALLTGAISVKLSHILSYNKACRKCLRHVSQEYYFCPYCGTEQDEQTEKHCVGCDRLIDQAEHYCSSCGTRQPRFEE